MNSLDVKLPEHQAIYLEIRNRILFGNLLPGQPVTIQGLADAIGAGMTPVREAIRRLCAEGALEAGGNRRVRVPEMTAARLAEIAFARQAVEPRMAERATTRITPEVLDALTSLDAEVDAAIADGDVSRYLEFNYRFHFTLYELADMPVLAQIAASLWLRMGPALRIVCGRMGTLNLPDKHSETLDALARRDAARTATAIAEDIAQGLGQVAATLPD